MGPSSGGAGAVAIQGEPGSNSWRAALRVLGPEARPESCASFAEVFAALEGGRATHAVLPFENSTAGLVPEVVDRLLQREPHHPLSGCGETRVAIRLVAACLPGASAQVRRLLTHPVAAAQCRAWVLRAGLEVVQAPDTAGAARLVRERGDPASAALCPEEAAHLHGLEVFAVDCNDARRTVTRFLLVAPGEAAPDPSDDARLLALHPQAGALHLAVGLLAQAGAHVRAVHSRPVSGSPGTHALLVELAGPEVASVTAALLADADALGIPGRVVASMRAEPSEAEGPR